MYGATDLVHTNDKLACRKDPNIFSISFGTSSAILLNTTFSNNNIYIYYFFYCGVVVGGR